MAIILSYINQTSALKKIYRNTLFSLNKEHFNSKNFTLIMLLIFVCHEQVKLLKASIYREFEIKFVFID